MASSTSTPLFLSLASSFRRKGAREFVKAQNDQWHSWLKRETFDKLKSGNYRYRSSKYEVHTLKVPVEVGAVVERELKMINRERIVELTRGDRSQIRRAMRIAGALEFTNRLVLTPKQQAVLNYWQLVGGAGSVLCSVRRRDTGATALWVRDGTTHMVLFEDGTVTKNFGQPVFIGSWFFNKRVTRPKFRADAEACAPKTMAVAQSVTGAKVLTFNRYH